MLLSIPLENLTILSFNDVAFVLQKSPFDMTQCNEHTRDKIFKYNWFFLSKFELHLDTDDVARMEKDLKQLFGINILAYLNS